MASPESPLTDLSEGFSRSSLSANSLSSGFDDTSPTAESPDSSNHSLSNRNNKYEHLAFDMRNTSMSSTNNLLEDRPDQQTIVGASRARVVDLTECVIRDLGHPPGFGGFSFVYKGTLHQEGSNMTGLSEQVIAIKCPRVYGSVGDEECATKLKKQLTKELMAWSKMAHINVIELLGTCRMESLEFECFVMEWCPYTLEQKLKSPSRLSEIQQAAMLLQLASGLTYMHGEDVVHSDIKPANVLIGRRGEVKIADFGLSRVIKNVDPTTGLKDGTLPYVSPELCNYDANAIPVSTTASDVWAFGIVAYQASTHLLEHDVRRMPYWYSGRTLDAALAKDAGQPPYRSMDVQLEATRYFIDTISMCWARDPNSRSKMGKLTTKLHEMFLKQDLSESQWSWLFEPANPRLESDLNVIGGANSDDLMRDSATKHKQGAYSEARAMRAQAAVWELFRGNMHKCADIQQDLADSCAGQFDREATIRHYNSAIHKYESLGPIFAETALKCRKMRDAAQESRHYDPGKWSSSLDRANQIGDLGEKALDDGQVETATRYFEELFDVARRDGRPDLMSQACLRLAWASERESLGKLSLAGERYRQALQYAKQANAAPNQRMIEESLQSLEGILTELRSLCQA